MTDREKVIGDLEKQIAWIRDNDFHKFPGWGRAVLAMRDALALLKAQEPHLLTLDEIHDSMVVYIEAGTKFLKIVDDDGVVLAIGGSSCANAKCFITVWNVGIAAMNDEYNVTWRAWSQRPTKEQREKEPWNRRANDDER